MISFTCNASINAGCNTSNFISSLHWMLPTPPSPSHLTARMVMRSSEPNSVSPFRMVRHKDGDERRVLFLWRLCFPWHCGSYVTANTSCWAQRRRKPNFSPTGLVKPDLLHPLRCNIFISNQFLLVGLGQFSQPAKIIKNPSYINYLSRLCRQQNTPLRLWVTGKTVTSY